MNAARQTASPLYTPENYNLEDSLGRLIADVSRQLQAAIDVELAARGLGITAAQWGILLRIANGCATTSAQLCRTTRHDTGSMTRMLDRLEDKGLIRRVRNPNDRRMLSLEITEEGRALYPLLTPVAIKVLNDHLDGFTREELNQFTGFLRRMRANSERQA